MAKNSKFDKRLKQISSEIILKLTQIDELKGQWIGGAKLSPQVLGRLKRSVLITSTGASTRIEGSGLPDEAVDKLMRGLAIQKFADRDKQEVKGYFELLENIFNSWEDLRFSESSIKHFHKELLKYVEKDILHRGNYKRKENQVRLIDTTAAYLTPKEMNELVDWTKQTLNDKKYHPLLIISNFIVEFLSIHPFEDGNGRLSRILTNLLLLQAGYLYMPYVSHEKLIEDKKVDYYMVLRKSQRTFKKDVGDITVWLEFFLKLVLTQSQQAISLMSGENIEDILSNKQIAVWQYLQQVDETTPLEIATKTQIAYATVRQTLAKLLDLKKIERVGLGRSTRYRKLKDLRL